MFCRKTLKKDAPIQTVRQKFSTAAQEKNKYNNVQKNSEHLIDLNVKLIQCWPVCRELQRKDSQQMTWFPHVVGESCSILQSQSKRNIDPFLFNVSSD